MFEKWLERFKKTGPFPQVNPERPFSAIGDIHGRADLLERALRLSQDHLIICVGDYVDRIDVISFIVR